MKSLILLGVLFLGCASHHGEIFPKPPLAAPLTLTPKQTTYEEVATGKTSAGDCVELSKTKYCQWDANVLVFEKNVLQKEINARTEPNFYIGLAKTLGDVVHQGHNVWLAPAKKSMNPKGLEWKSHLAVLEATFSTSGMRVVQDKKDADQIIKVGFGMKQISPGNFSRSLKYTSYLAAKAGVEIWSIEVTTQGAGSDLKKILPSHAAIAKSYLSNFREENREFKVSENDLNIVAFKDFTKTPQ